MKLNLRMADWLLAIGGALGTYAVMGLVWRLTRKDVPQAQQLPAGGSTAPSPAPPAAPPSPTPGGGQQAPLPPQQLGAPYLLIPGKQYLAAVSLTGIVSALASTSKVKGAAEGEGFTNVGVSDTIPGWWPGREKADYYISALYSGAPKTVPRKPHGSVDIVTAYQA